MSTKFTIPHIDQLMSSYDAAGDDMQSMMEGQLRGEKVDEGEFSKLVAKRLCLKDTAEAFTKNQIKLTNILVKDNA